MYTGKIALTQSNAVDIIKASDLFELTAVKSTTLKFIEDYISFDVSIASKHFLEMKYVLVGVLVPVLILLIDDKFFPLFRRHM